jgi:hypothetical protein
MLALFAALKGSDSQRIVRDRIDTTFRSTTTYRRASAEATA